MSDENQKEMRDLALEFLRDDNDDYYKNQKSNNSGAGPDSHVPDVVAKRFNWGVFFLTWIWGLGNKSFITFFIFATTLVSWVPFIGFLAPLAFCIWCGIKGNEWAWQNKHFNSVNEFHEIQRKWAIAGIASFVIFWVIILAIILSIFPMFSGSSDYKIQNYQQQETRINNGYLRGEQKQIQTEEDLSEYSEDDEQNSVEESQYDDEEDESDSDESQY